MIARPLYALLATLALGACAHAAGGAAPATVTETSALSSSSPATVPPDKPTAEGLLGQLLVLIKGSQNISDFTPERLNSTMGQAVQFVKGDERRYRPSARSLRIGVMDLESMKPSLMADGSNSASIAMWPVHRLR